MTTRISKGQLEVWSQYSTAKARSCKKDSSYKNYLQQKEKERKALIERRKAKAKERLNAMKFDDAPKSDILQEPHKDKEVTDKSVEENLLSSQKLDTGLPSLSQCAELLKQKIQLINYSGNLYYYNGKCYDMIEKADTIIRLYREKVDNRLGGVKSLNQIKQLHTFLKTDPEIYVSEFNINERIAVLNNGIFDVMNQQLSEHTPETVTFSYLNADYVEDRKCKHFDKFLDSVTEGDSILKDRFWMFLGYVFMQTTEAKVFFVMGEAPDSGKSLLGNFIQSIYPCRYVSNIPLTDFSKDFSVAPIAGSAVNISLDLPSSKLNTSAVSKIKMFTGGDTININQKYEPVFSYENRAKLIFASNFPVILIEGDDAFWNRLIYLPFNKSVPKANQNRELPRLFQKEKDAIVSKALRYAKKLIDSGFEFPTTRQIEYKIREWQGKTCATIEDFIDECCICGDNCKGELVENLYSNYKKYCYALDFVPENRNWFKKFLQEQIGLKHTKMRDGGENPRSAFQGIQLRRDII